MLAESTVFPNLTTDILALLAIATNAISVYVALYVKASIAPLAVQQQTTKEAQDVLFTRQAELGREVDIQGKDLALLHGQCQGCKIMEYVDERLERAKAR